MQEENDKQRLDMVERKLAELERLSRVDVTLLISALMARTDGFISDLNEVKRGQTKIVDQVGTGLRETNSRIDDLAERFESLEQGFDKLLNIQQGYKSAIETLQAGQEQILAILTRQAPRND